MVLLLMVCDAAESNANQPLIQSLAWKFEANGRATLPELEVANDWQLFDGSKSWGFGSEAIWVRYQLRAALPGETEPWIVRVQPSYLDNLTLYDPIAQLEFHTGETLWKRDDALGSINFTFQIPALPNERNIYLRLNTQTARLILTDAMPLRAAQAQNQTEEWLFGFLVSLSILFALWATMQWALNPERVMGAFAIKQWIASIWAFSHLGFARVLLSGSPYPEFLTGLEYSIRAWTIAVTIAFLAMLIEDYRPSKRWMRTCFGFVAMLLVLPLIQFAGLTRLMSIIGNGSVVICLLLIWGALLSASSAIEKQPIPRPFLLIYLFIYTALNSVPSAMRLGLLPMNNILLAGNLSHALLDGLVMFLLLQLRARNMQTHAQRVVEQNQMIAMNLDRAQQGIEYEQRRRREQSQFLHMLMHELKTPLAIVSLAMSNRNNREENLMHAGRAVQDMKTIIDRCVEADQMGGQRLTLHRRTVDVGQLVASQVQSMPQLASRLHLLASSNLPTVQTDEQMLQIVVTNLLDNALHYSDPRTAIGIHLASTHQDDQAGLTLSVSNVPGLAGWPDAQQLFTKYYRASGAKRESGSGLGLYLSRQLAQSLGGSLTYKPDNQLVTFELWIPLNFV